MNTRKTKKSVNQRFTDFLNSFDGLKVTWLGFEPMALSPVRVDTLLIFTSRVDDL
jgi:hypothetical protein